MLNRCLLVALCLLECAECHVFQLNSAARFQKLVQKGRGHPDASPWLVAFVAPWCNHCKVLEPKWRSAAAESGRRREKGTREMKFGWMDIADEGREELAFQFDLRSFPTILYFDAKGSAPSTYRGNDAEEDILHFARQELRADKIGSEHADYHRSLSSPYREESTDEVVMHPEGYPIMKSQLPKAQAKATAPRQEVRPEVKEVKPERLLFHNQLPVDVRVMTLVHGRESPEGMIAAGSDLMVADGNVQVGKIWMAKPVDSADSRIWRFTVASGSPMQHLPIAAHTHSEL